MNLERVGVGIVVLLCVGLVGWNLKLQRDLDALGDRLVEAERRGADAQAFAKGLRMARLAQRGQVGQAPTADNGAWGPAAAAGPSLVGRAPPPPPPDWDALRAQMESTTVDVVEALGEQYGWRDELTDDVIEVLMRNGEAVAALWRRVRDGELSHAEARNQMGELRADTRERVAALIGTDARDELDERLLESRRAMLHGPDDGSAVGEEPSAPAQE